MKYQPPLGVQNPDASYINGDPTVGRLGSIPPDHAFEYPMRELLNVITKSKITPADDDLMQVAKGIRSQRMNYVDDTGSANALSVALDPPLGAYTIGLMIRVKIHATNTGGATIDAGAGRVPIKLMNGGGTSAGDLPAGGICELVYDGAAFQLTNFIGGGGTGGGTNFYIKIPYAVDTSPTPNIVIAAFAPAITTLAAGDCVLVKINNTNTGSSVIRINALPDKPIMANGAGPLLQGDIVKNDVVLFIFDGTSFWITPNPVITADCQFNVPSQFATPPDVLAAVKRKTIAQSAMVTILIQGGAAGSPYIVNPFTINHANADRITIKGTMLAAAPTAVNFAQTGNSAGARAADSANNIAMLRSRYGTEIRCAAGQTGIVNTGPNEPIIKDLIVTGPNYNGSQAMGIGAGLSRNIRCDNVSCWGLDNGWYGGGFFICNACFACGCFGYGWLLTGPGGAGLSYSCAFGNTIGGIVTNQNGFIGCAPGCQANFNGSIGAGAGDNSELSFNTSTATGNGAIDLTASVVSELIASGSVFGTTSPSPGVMGNYGAVVIVI